MKGKPGRKTAQPKTRPQKTSEGAEVLPGQSLCPVVGIGASAGGIEALIRLFEALPPGLPRLGPLLIPGPFPGRVIASVWAKPLSPAHVNSSVPLSVATVKKAMYGLADMA